MIAAISTQKGGVGKTTICYHLGVGLARRGLKVLMVDADSQAHLSKWLVGGIDDLPEVGFADVIEGRAPLAEAIVGTEVGGKDGPDLLSGHGDLGGTSDYLVTQTGGDYLVEERMEGVSEFYDIVLIDCPPNISKLNLAILVWARQAWVVADLSPLGMEGAVDQFEVMEIVRRRLRSPIEVGFVIPNNYSGTNVSRGALEFIQKKFGDIVTDPVRESVVLKECPAHYHSIWESGARGSGPRNDLNQVVKKIGEGLKNG